MKIKGSEIVVILVLLPHFMNGFYDHSLSESSLAVYTVLRLVTTAFIPLIGMIVLFKGYNYQTADFGLVVSNKFINVRGVVLASVILLLFWYYSTVFYNHRIYGIFIKWIPTNYLQMPYPRSMTEFSLILHIFLAISAGFFEEIYYRGLLYKIFRERRMGAVSIILISSLLFTLVHWEAGIHWLPAVFVPAIVMAWFYHRYKTVWPSIVAHTLVGLISILYN